MVSRTFFRDENKRKIMIIRRGSEIRDNKSNKLIDGKRAENCCEKMRHLMPLNRCTFLQYTEIRNYRDIYRPSMVNIVWYNRINDWNVYIMCTIVRWPQPITHNKFSTICKFTRFSCGSLHVKAWNIIYVFNRDLFWYALLLSSRIIPV